MFLMIMIIIMIIMMMLLLMMMIMIMLLMMFMMVLLLLMMMIIGITLRDLVHAIPYYAIQEGMRKMMMILIIIPYHLIMTISIYLYNHIYRSINGVDGRMSSTTVSSK